MIAAAAEKVIVEVKKAIATAAADFSKLDRAERAFRLTKAEAACARSGVALGKQAPCPACGGCCVVRGERRSGGEPRLDDVRGSIGRGIVVLPTEFDCFSCGLQLRGHGALHAAELGGNYKMWKELDPVEYFNIQFDPSPHLEAEYEPDEYGND